MKKNNSSGGIGIFGVLALIFIVLKLCKVITWSWIWVLSPLWIGAIITLSILGLLVILELLKRK